MVASQLKGWDYGPCEFLFIENVGNLVCPASYDLGESLRVVLLSVTEGEDKPLKYPKLFNTADVAVVTKMDLAEVCEYDHALACENMQSVRPGMRVFETSAKSGQGMAAWLDFLREQRQQARSRDGQRAMRVKVTDLGGGAVRGRHACKPADGSRLGDSLPPALFSDRRRPCHRRRRDTKPFPAATMQG